MKFQKLALAAAVAAAPAAGLAMEPMADSQLSNVTGQDGLVISLASDVSAGLKIHDTDGAVGATGANGAGAIIIDGFSITRALPATDSIDIEIDADDGAAGTAPFLNIGVSLPNNLAINLGTVDVAASGRDDATPAWTTTTANEVTGIVNLGSMTLGATSLNIQLGNEPQGAMVALNTTISNGISITGFSVTDATSLGSFSTDLQVVDSGGANLTVDTTIDISDGSAASDLTDKTGIVIGLDNIGTTGAVAPATNGVDIRMANVNVGGAGDIGDIEIIGLDLTGDLVISGK